MRSATHCFMIVCLLAREYMLATSLMTDSAEGPQLLSAEHDKFAGE